MLSTLHFLAPIFLPQSFSTPQSVIHGPSHQVFGIVSASFRVPVKFQCRNFAEPCYGLRSAKQLRAIVLLWLADDFFAEPWLQDLGHLDGSVCLLMVFHNRNNGSADRNSCAI
jgi:hypothetical protein